MVFNCNHCGKPINCLAAVYNGEFLHHTCREEIKKEEKENSEEEVVSEE